MGYGDRGHPRARRAAPTSHAPVHVQRDEAEWVQASHRRLRLRSRAARQRRRRDGRRHPDHAHAHARAHAGEPVLPRRRQARRRRHAVPRRLRPHRPARAATPTRCTRASRSASPSVPDDTVLYPGHLYSPEPSATMGETRAAQLRVPRPHASSSGARSWARERREEQPSVSSVRLDTDRIDSAVGAALVAELLHDLMATVRRRARPRRPAPDDLAPPHGTFLVAWLDDEPVGCGGVRAHDAGDVGEIKRMYVQPAARGAGASRVRSSRQLEDRARATRLRAPACSRPARASPRRSRSTRRAATSRSSPTGSTSDVAAEPLLREDAVTGRGPAVRPGRRGPAGESGPRNARPSIGGAGRVGVEAQVRQPVEDRVEADAQLEAREVHAEALVLAGAERHVVLHRAVEVELVGVLVARLVVVRRRR